MGFFSKLFNGLKKTKDNLSNKIAQLFKKELDDEFYEELEFILVSADISHATTTEIIAEIKAIAKKEKIKTQKDFIDKLKSVVVNKIDIFDESDEFPECIVVVGVNGVGKTTAIGKLAHNFKSLGKSVLLVAGDTFRAAAAEQLSEWAKRSKVRIVKYAEGADPGAVVFDGIASAVAKKDDVVLVDTAGRLHNKVNLMEELAKINRIILREWKGSIKRYLVLDATTGQNAIAQFEAFNESVEIDGIILTKMDGTAKGGVVISIINDYNIPVKYIGVGEGVDDLCAFNATEFVDAIF